MKIGYCFHRIREYGLKRTVLVAFSRVEGLVFDLRFGTETFSRVAVDDMGIAGAPAAKQHGSKYDSSHISGLRSVFRRIPIGASDVFVDFGCGKGSAVLVASQCGFKEVVGVEMATSLCETARRNAAAMRSRGRVGCPITINEGDASSFEIRADFTHLYFFNPFDEVVMAQVVTNAITSLHQCPRRMFAIYCHPTCAHVFDTCPFSRLVFDGDYFGRYFRVYELALHGRSTEA